METLSAPSRVTLEGQATDLKGYCTECASIVEPLRLTEGVEKRLKNSLMLFFMRSSDRMEAILEQRKATVGDQGKMSIESTRKTKFLAARMREVLEAGDLDGFGRLLDESWHNKSAASTTATPYIDHAYAAARKLGALGGKTIDVDGRFLLLYCHPESQPAVRVVMEALKLSEVPFAFDFDRARILAENDPPGFPVY